LPPLLFGILNITPDSFSDGGRFLAPEAALAQAKKLVADGADVLDLGGASSNPDSAPVAAETEIARLEPVVAEARRSGWQISVDSFAPVTQAWALEQGVAYLNDIRGFPDADLYPALAKSPARLIVMHSVQGGRATSVETDPGEIVPRVLSFFEDRIKALTAAGIARERLILDPGMGFFLGADPEVSLTVLRRLPELRQAFGLPVLISVSRKGFLRKLTGRKVAEIGPASLAAELYAVRQGADMIRTHDPGALRDALTIWADIADGEPSQKF
jgi:dihydropteroate synthase type 2